MRQYAPAQEKRVKPNHSANICGGDKRYWWRIRGPSGCIREKRAAVIAWAPDAPQQGNSKVAYRVEDIQTMRHANSAHRDQYFGQGASGRIETTPENDGLVDVLQIRVFKSAGSTRSRQL
jgi:hypothetical protein